MSDLDLDDLRAELGEYAQREKGDGAPAREQRIIAGFEEIERFYAEHGRMPQHGEDRDIFERLYAVRLDQIRASEECRAVLNGRDSRGLLEANAGLLDANRLREDPAECDTKTAEADEPDEEEVLAALRGEVAGASDLAQLKHVRSREEIRAAEEVAKRNPCLDFDAFRPVFEQAQLELDTGKRKTFKYKDYANVQTGDLFILDGQKVLVADMGEQFVSEHGRPDRRLRVIYDNGMESDLLLRSLQRALNKDKTSRRITDPGHGPLFSDEEEEGDLPTGIIYVLRSKSDHPFVSQNRDVLHKIGVTGGDLKARIAQASKQPTYLMAEVEIVATFKLSNVNRSKLEGLLHKFFATARLDVELKNQFGFQVEPREWFLVPLAVIERAVRLLMEGSLAKFRYEPQKAKLIPASPIP